MKIKNYKDLEKAYNMLKKDREYILAEILLDEWDEHSKYNSKHIIDGKWRRQMIFTNEGLIKYNKQQDTKEILNETN